MGEKGYQKLYWKIVTTTLSFSLIPLFVLGYTIYHQFKVSYTAKIMESLQTLTENRRTAIDLFLDERLSQLHSLAYTHSYDQLTDEDYLNRVFTLIQMRAKSFVDLGIISQDGDHVAYVGPYQLKNLNYKNESWFPEVMLRGIYISDVFTGFRKFPHFIIAVLRREGDRNWILRATIDTDIFDNLVKAAQVGKKGDAFVVNRDKTLQTTPRFSGEVMSKLEQLELSKFSGTRVEEGTFEGETVLFGMTWLRNKEWLLVVKEDPGEEFSPLLHARFLVLSILTGGILAIIVGTIFLTRLMVGQLIKADREKAILDSNLMQSSKMAALGKLAAGIAHEVNNPLAVIKEKVGWIKDLLEEEELAKSENFQEFEEAVVKIDQHVDRAKRVTHRLLGFARRMEPMQESVNVNKVLEDTIDFLRNEAHYRNITIRTEYAEDLPVTTSDSAQLQQVFLNILNNGIDAVGRNGEISVVTCHKVREGQISVSISDTGPGIPSEQINQIFDPFFTTKEVGKGTGLGLSISYSIIEKLGGNISVASEPGKGTTFTIILPIMVPSQTPPMDPRWAF
ncbi:MAG: two-component sensor histidine kinase [Deltaproteobacteria bacterium]|nr:two-component sensor histidine kinase [Deltaproteobacteria bacterium]